MKSLLMSHAFVFRTIQLHQLDDKFSCDQGLCSEFLRLAVQVLFCCFNISVKLCQVCNATSKRLDKGVSHLAYSKGITMIAPISEALGKHLRLCHLCTQSSPVSNYSFCFFARFFSVWNSEFHWAVTCYFNLCSSRLFSSYSFVPILQVINGWLKLVQFISASWCLIITVIPSKTVHQQVLTVCKTAHVWSGCVALLWQVV